MSQKTHSQDSNFNKEEEVKKSIQAYKEAAKADAFMFGDYDGYEAYEEEGQQTLFFYKYSYKNKDELEKCNRYRKKNTLI